MSTTDEQGTDSTPVYDSSVHDRRGSYSSDAALQDKSKDWPVDSSSTDENGTENESGLSSYNAEGQQFDDDQLSSLAYLQKYGASSNVSERQNAAKNIVKTLQNVEHDEAAVQVVFAMVKKDFAEDQDAAVRAELLEQLPMVCMHCSQNPSLQPYVRDALYPLFVKFLNDSNAQVRKTCQAAVLILVEQGLLTVDDIVELIYPELMKLSESWFPDDVRVESVCLLCKLISKVGRERTIKLFLNRFTELCDDPLFHVRKTCASHLGELSRVLGQEMTERLVVPHLISLSQDSVWGVRKTCAECFTDISYNCAMQTRRHQLAPVFIILLADSSRWVQCSAFQALGPFISTFADSGRTGLKWVEGELVYDEPSNVPSAPPLTDSSTVSLRSDYSVTQSESATVTSGADGKLSRILDACASSSSSAFTSNIAQLARQRLSEDMRKIVETCIVDMSPSFVVRSERKKDDGDRSTADSLTDGQTEADTEFHSFKYWQSNYWDVDDDLPVSKVSPLPEIQDDADDDLPLFDPVDEYKDEYTNEEEVVEETLDDSAQRIDVPIQRTDDSTKRVDDPVRRKEDSTKRVDGPVDRIDSTIQRMDTPVQQTIVETPSDFANDDTDQEIISLTGAKSWLERLKSAEEKQSEETAEEAPTHQAGLEEKPGSGKESQENEERRLNEQSPEQQTCQGVWYSRTERQVDHRDQYISFTSPGHCNITMSPDVSPKEFEYQDIIPQALLDQFLSMVEPSRAQTIESDISRHCAFNLPAVAFTIGRQHWPLIKPTYLALANDMQWKVRRTLAFSIHELAAILGNELTVQDLLPVFSGFLRDLDEVKIGILRHLYDFLKLLDKDVRRSLLPSLADFLQTDNYRSWRFRHLFAEQLISVCELFDIEDINDYLSPIAMTLAIDKIAEIRQVTHKLLATILYYFYTVEAARSAICDITDSFIQDIVKGFAKSQRWVRRQTFVYVCREVYRSSAVSEQKFSNDLLPHLLNLAPDPIPNVRVGLSSLFAEIYSSTSQSSLDLEPMKQVVQVINYFSTDRDRDVRLNAILGTLKGQLENAVLCDQTVFVRVGCQ